LAGNTKGNTEMNKQRNRERALAQAADRHTEASGGASDGSWLKLVTDPDLQAVVAFCLIGLLLALNLMLRFPDMGAVIAQYNQF
jgi:hypothetical protein